MRVIAGLFRGRKLEAPPGEVTRPITDRVKETLFNILGHRLAMPGQLPGLDVLDLFAGPGSLGIEALSRGARSCVFVEQDRQALRSLRQNIGHLDIEAVCTILADNAWSMRVPQRNGGFGLIFVDPPYRDARNVRRVLDLLDRLAPALAAGGLIAFRCPASSPALPTVELRGLQAVDERVVGRMRLVLLGRASHGRAGAGGATYERPD
jgi:16S rRNA (guanine966-N2)-methyltransferase